MQAEERMTILPYILSDKVSFIIACFSECENICTAIEEGQTQIIICGGDNLIGHVKVSQNNFIASLIKFLATHACTHAH